MANVRFVLTRGNWQRGRDGWLRLPGDVAVASFTSADEAEVERSRREAECRAVVGNPFRCGPWLHYLSSFPEAVFLDWLLDADLTPPTASAGQRDWVGWWDGSAGGWTAQQRERVWAGLDRLWFFEVRERPPARTAYAVVRVLWEYNDNYQEPGAEGGETVSAFRRREDAEALRDLLEAQARAERQNDEEDDSYWRFDVDRWRTGPFDAAQQDEHTFDLVSGQEATFYEVLEIELGPDVATEARP